MDVANQTAIAQQQFSYEPPTIDLIDGQPTVISGTSSLHNHQQPCVCAARVLTSAHSLMTTDIPTTGTEYLVVLNGSNFGVLGPIVTVGSIEVPLASYDHYHVSFQVPEGQGANLPIVLNVSGQLSAVGSATLSYASPRVTSYSPEQLSGDTRGGEHITLHGENFGTSTLVHHWFGVS